MPARLVFTSHGKLRACVTGHMSLIIIIKNIEPLVGLMMLMAATICYMRILVRLIGMVVHVWTR